MMAMAASRCLAFFLREVTACGGGTDASGGVGIAGGTGGGYLVE